MTVTVDPFAATAAGARQAAWAELAGQGPVVHATLPNGLQVWLVTHHAEARTAMNDERLAKSGTTTTVMISRLRPELLPALASHMLRAEGPDHARLRRLIGAAFTRRPVDALSGRIGAIVGHLLDGLALRSAG